MSINRGNAARTQAPQSPFAPRRLGFSNKEMNDLRTPQTNITRSKAKTNSNNSRNRNKENKAPETPSHKARDSQYKEWLQSNGFHQLFRDSNALSSVIRILRQYSEEIYTKIEQILTKNNELNQWKIEVGEPALHSIQRYQLIEAELKSAQNALNEEYQEKNRQYHDIKNELNDVKIQIRDIYSPKIIEYDKVLNMLHSIQKEDEILKNEIMEINKNNESLNKKNKSLNQEFDKEIKEYQSQITHLNECLIKYRQTEREREEEGDDILDLPPQFLNEANNSRFDWNLLMNDDENDNDNNTQINDHDPDEIRDGFNELSMKLESLNTSQRKEQETNKAEFAKLHENVQKLCEKHGEINEMKKSLISLNTSISTIQGPNSFQLADENALFNNMNNINDKLDKLTQYLSNLRLDQRIITLYKKIDHKIDENNKNNGNDNDKELLELLHSIQFEQESQSKLIDNSLSTFRELFENQLNDIMKHIKEKELTKPKSPSISPIKPIKTTPIKANDTLVFKANDCNYNEIMNMNCNRLNEMIMSEFVLVLINCLSAASQMATNKLFICIIKITNNLLSFQWETIKSVFFFNNDNNDNNNERYIIQYKSEIDNLFQNIFQNTINSVIQQLINNKMDRVKLQSKIAKLTNKLQQTNLNQSQNKKIIMMRQFKNISLKQIYYPLIIAALVVFVIGMFCGYCFVGNTSAYSVQQQTQSNDPHYSFMSK